MRRVSKKRQSLLAERRRVVAFVHARDRVCQAPTRLDGVEWPEHLLAAVRALPERCGSILDAHEIIPRSAWPGGWLEPSNVILACRPGHHDWIGDWPEAAHFVGLHGFSYERPDGDSG